MTTLDPPSPERDPIDSAARDDLRGLFELEQVHRGGPASLVCLARDLEYNQPVALKVWARAATAGADAEEAFHRAAALVAALDHPQIVPLYSAGATDRFFWCAMQYIEGRSLADRLRAGGPLDFAACLHLVAQVATALDSAHRLGVVHATLTPANVLLDAADDVHVTDFWIPWVLERLGALPGDGGKARRGKYRAPEQHGEGQCGPEADQYALATLTRTCLMKTPAHVPPDMGRAIERALTPAPDARFPSVREFAAALGITVAGPQSGGHPVLDDDDEDELPDPAQPSRWRWVPAGLLTLVVLGAVAAPWLRSRGSVGDRTLGSESTSLPPAADSFALAEPEPSPLDSTVPLVRPPTPAPPAQRVAPRSPAPVRKTPPAPAPRRDDVSSLSTPGRLFVNSTPWGQVYVDGELLGNTPRVNVPVAPGAHRLRVVRDGFAPYELAIRMQPGQELRLTDIVLQEVKP